MTGRGLRATLHRLLPGLVFLIVRSRSSFLNALRAGVLPALAALIVPATALGQTFLMADGAQWETCTGTFYDSGGAAGNYGSNESMTATLCPSGGAGSGPFTSVTFTVWSVGLTDLLDNLVIHNGASASDPVLATGSLLNSLQGQTFTSTDPSGCLTFVWTSDLLLNDAGWAAEIHTGPDAGGNGSVTVCSSAADLDLFTVLSGSPDVGGQWTFGGNLVSNTFSPATSPGGVYTYTVPAVAPCVDAVATVTVTKVTAANAGFDNAIEVCSSEAAFSMRSRLLGAPQAGGTWTLSGNSHGDQFNPATDVGGVYTYLVSGTAPCADATAQLTITMVEAPSAGTNGTLNVCSTASAQDLFASLVGSPDAGGTWTKPGNLPHSGQFIPGTDPAGTYTYRVAGQSPCADATATVAVTVQTAVDPGTSTSTSVCSNGASVNIKTLLGTTATGTWSGPSTVTSNLYDPVTMTPGTYTFSVAATGVCPSVSATVGVTEVQAPDAGNNGTLTVCSSGANVDLFTRLGGAPNSGGTWTTSGNIPFPTGIFVPGTSTAGTYTYTVAGTAPCANDQATVTVTQVTARNAGTNGTLTTCSSSAPTDMFPLLGGGPQAGGTWYKPVPPGGAVAGSFYNPALPGLPAGVYTYVLTGTAPCPNDSATVTVVENQAPNAGTNGTLTLCNTGATVNLISALGGSPGGSGSWLDPSNQPFPTGQFNPATGTAGAYKYIITGTAPCINDTGFVTVTVHQQPNAGFSGDTIVCSDGPDFPLLSVLNGTPGSGGQWSPGNGTYDCGTGQAGSFTYTITATAPCVNASAVATVAEIQRPNAGGNGSVTLCSTEPPLNLFSRLTGSPQPGGTWTPGDPSGVYTPGTSTAGVYTYTLPGAAPCANSTATVTVTQNQAPDPGTDATVTICAGTGILNLFPELGGSPDPGGTWSSLDNIAPGSMTNGLFTYTGVGAGNYDFQYTVAASGGCPGDFAEVRVTITATLDAGTNGNCSVCRTNTAYNLFSCLNGTPQQGGTWKRLPAGTVVSPFYNASVDAPGTYQFRYVLTGSVGCQSDSSLVSITVIAAPEAGPVTANVTYCSSGAIAALMDNLPGAQSGGQWKKQGQPGISTGNYNPPGTGAFDSPGLFYYIVPGNAPCGADTARLTVNEVVAPNAGTSVPLTRCILSPAFNMTQQLGGSPAANGVWTAPGGVTHSSTFVPGVDPGGTWTYTVPGTAPCANGTAQLTITIAAQPNAGLDGTLNICSNAADFPLSNVLNGTPGTGGTWYDSTGSVVPSQFFFPDPTTTGENVFTYVVAGTAPCVNDTAVATIFESKEADAGITSSVQHCPTNGALDLFDVLGGTPDPTGSWSNGFNGTYVPGINTPGPYTYTVTGVPPCTSASATVTVAEVVPPSAGVNTSLLVCTSDEPFGLADELNGDPDPGGTWYLSGQISPVFFNPGTRPPGTYVFLYVVDGEGTCVADSATLTITLFQEVDAGCNGTLQLCSSSPSTPLFPSLGCTPQTGGTWRRPGGQSHTGIFNPATDPVGFYTYRRAANGACPADSATVLVSLVQQPNAGGPGQATACSDQAPFPLINFLSGNPQTGGTWTDPQGDPHSGIYVPQFDGPGIYTYTLAGVSPCSGSSAQVNVIEYQRPFAGEDGFRQVCSDESGTFPLITVLTGGPNPLGTWYAPGGAAYPQGTFDPGVTTPGQYTYVVQGNAPCPNDTSKVTVLQTTAPEAGISTAVQVCNTAGGQSLNDLLGGDPDAGGTWTDPAGQAHSSTFDPAVDPPGTYKYRVGGVSPCGNDSATVTISLVSAPNAGSDGALSACISENSVTLFDGIGGSPQPNGTWTGANQVNGIFNPTQVAPGTYPFIYTVNGGGTCAADQSTVTVTVTNALDAGTAGTGEVCSGTEADLFTFLTGAPQLGGIWRDMDNTNAVDDEGVFDASIVGVGQYGFRYVHEGTDNCPGDSALVTITVIPGPDAGSNSTVPLCSSANQLQLITLLGGSPDTDGQWYGPTFNAVSGTFDPATGSAGIYTYVAPGEGGCANDSAEVNILLNIAPNAGGNGSLTICADGDPTDLFPLLAGSPDATGSWTCCGGVNHSGIYIPAVNNTGGYTYTVTGQGACPNASATVFVTEQAAPNAGASDVITACSSAVPFSMLDELSGSPQNTGVWTDPDGQVHNVIFDPAADSSGVYTYTVSGGSACAPAIATLTVDLIHVPDAGADSTLAACATETAVDLFAALGPEADTGGIWTDITGVGAALQDGIFDASAVGIGTFLFGYNLPGNGPCLGDNATLTVEVGAGLDPGIGGTDTICGGNSAYNMFGSLSGTPNHDGVWTSGSVPGVLTDSLLNASLLPPGGPYPFSYTVTDPGCGEASSVVSLYISAYPDPGADTTITVCSTANPFGLFNLLGGSPDAGGTWTTLNGVAVSPSFNPGTDDSGSFRYNLPGSAPCNDTSAVITITVNDPPNAGADATLLECNSGSLNLNTALLPDAQPGGSWIDNGNTGQLAGPILNLGGLAAGPHPFTYLLVVPSCGTDMASYLLTAVEAVRVTDTVLTCNEDDRTYTVSVTIEGGDPMTYSVTGLDGTMTIESPYIFTSSPILTSQSFSIIVTDTNDCGPRVVEGITPCDFEEPVFVPESFTPNGDGANDVFVIPGIEGFPGNTIDIFNRWGSEVYSAAGYNNRTVVWNGTADNALLSGDLPTGTYYYVLELGNGIEPLKGFVYLNR